MKRMMAILIVIGGSLVASGCLQMESAHRLYLLPQGELSWTVQQTDVRSDAAQAAARQQEEGQWLSGIAQGSHAVAVAFETLGARQVRTDFIRRARPYGLIVTGEFGRIDDVANRVLTELKIGGRATLTRQGDTMTLAIEMQAPEDGQEYDGALTALFDELQNYRIVLTDGRFVEAEGFAISGDGTVATSIAPPNSRDIRLSLTWK